MWLTATSGAGIKAGFAHHAYSFLYSDRIPRAQEILGEERPVHTAEHLASAMFWMGVPRVDFHSGARGSLVGAEYHCIHGAHQKTVFKVLGCTAPREITMQIDFPFVGTVWRTDRIEAEGPSTTRVDSAISWKTNGIKAPVLDFMASRMLRRYGALYDKRVSEMLEASKADVTRA